jgi:hypothetical protein
MVGGMPYVGIVLSWLVALALAVALATLIWSAVGLSS